jgi:hypothetical protein
VKEDFSHDLSQNCTVHRVFGVLWSGFALTKGVICPSKLCRCFSDSPIPRADSVQFHPAVSVKVMARWPLGGAKDEFSYAKKASVLLEVALV